MPGGERRWVLAAADTERVGRLAAESGVSLLLATLLANRGISDAGAAEAFLEARLAKHVRSPMLFRDMERASDRILAALRAAECIGIYGDYDVDGISGTALLVRFFRAVGCEPVVHIPDRLRDGYGLNERGIRVLAEAGVRVLVTVDCGGVSHAEIALAVDLGMDVIVCDHHQVAAQPLPAYAVLNPIEPDAGFPFSGLCGTGVAFYLALGVRMRMRATGWGNTPDLRRCLDLVALGTIADLVPLVQENRVLVRAGLRELEQSSHPGVKALKQVSGVDRLSAGAVGFRLAPRLNAGGRLADARLGVLLLTTSDEAEAERLAARLDAENRERQAIERRILEEAVDMVEAGGGIGERRSIVLASTAWHPGVIGIVASRLVERYYRPTVLIALDGEHGAGRGSARSISGLNIHAAIAACRVDLEGFGGHPMAAGLRMQAARVDSFAAGFERAVQAATEPDDYVPVTRVDAEIELACVDLSCVAELSRLEPYGQGNRTPVLASRGVRVRSCRRVGKDGDHLKLVVEQGGHSIDAIGFGMGARGVSEGGVLDILFTPMEHEWKGRRSVELHLRDLRQTR